MSADCSVCLYAGITEDIYTHHDPTPIRCVRLTTIHLHSSSRIIVVNWVVNIGQLSDNAGGQCHRQCAVV
jgi:hypothetical protein